MAEKAELVLMRTSPTGTSQQGFTLLELVLVVTLMGLLLGVALPNWQKRRQEVSLRLASSQLAQLCRYGVALATSKKQEILLRWDGVQFSLIEEELAEPLEKYRLPANCEYQGPESVIFLATGGLQEECFLELIQQEEKYTVQIDSQGSVRNFPGGRDDG